MTDKSEIVELDRSECWTHLGEEKIGRLAVSAANKPDIFPVNYLLDGETIVVRTAPGFKLAAATLGPAVAFEVDRFDEATRTGWSVVVHGPATEVEGLEELLRTGDLGVDPWAAGEKNHYIRIEPTEVTGRRIPAVG